ncbi:hypothetical protein ACM614_20555 [Streptomyces sp. 12297]|uniref:hypothetical protein n=1 Tax=Streptomyces sp. NBC_00239 TaxID=2903640 RepID=UPI002E2E6D79|nr:hypothetical protein [Streptomyces sp. NBC_00239]
MPYLALKTAWVAGSHIGIPEGSVLRDPDLTLTVANATTIAMDATLAVLVLLLTRPWGLRVPAWLLTVPVYVATGLLAPICAGYPAQLVLKAFGGTPLKADAEPFLEPWVFAVVYTGFIVQALALAGLFVPYARERWGRRWQGPLGARMTDAARVAAGAAAVAALAVAAPHLYWAFGGAAGLGGAGVDAESSTARMMHGVHALFALGAGAGALILARGGRVRARMPLAVAWIGSSATACWGAWMTIALAGELFDTDQQAPTALLFAYAGQMITGGIVAAVLTRFLTARRTV